MFIEMEQTNGRTVWVNPNQIVWLRKNNDNSTYLMCHGVSILVKGSMADIRTRFNTYDLKRG